MEIKVGIITISDRAAAGAYADSGGPALRAAACGHGWVVTEQTLVPDEVKQIQAAIVTQVRRGSHVILTTGGTGISARDVTPEAVRQIASKELPGFGEVMRAASLKVTPNAILSRNLAAVVEKTLVICLPGKPSAAVECLAAVASAVPHGVAILTEAPANC